jgi:hypothetical protein
MDDGLPIVQLHDRSGFHCVRSMCITVKEGADAAARWAAAHPAAKVIAPRVASAAQSPATFSKKVW